VATTPTGDTAWATSRGHSLTSAEARFTGCTASLTPVLVVPSDDCPVPTGTAGFADEPPGSTDPPGSGDGARQPSPAQRIDALACSLLDAQMPLAVGRTHRHATPAQRRALAARDQGCLIPGCQVPAEACQAHHLTPWSDGGETTLENMVLLCWTHHRQVDLGMWTIRPADPNAPLRQPSPGAPPGTQWPANNASPWIITASPRSRWGSR
jgi:hypothetical protein